MHFCGAVHVLALGVAPPRAPTELQATTDLEDDDSETAGLNTLLEASNYSHRLYGEKGSLARKSGLNMRTLRIVYLDLLDRDILELLESRVSSGSCVGIEPHNDWCWKDQPRRRHLKHGISPLRKGALWLVNGKVRTFFEQVEQKKPHSGTPSKVDRVPRDAPAVANDAWIEGTHCATPHMRTARSIPVSGAWFYTAPGAGVSVHVGKTLAFQEADLLDAGLPITNASDW